MTLRPDHPIDAARANRRLVIRVVRMAFFVLITTVALVTFIQRVTDQSFDQTGFNPTSIRTGASGPGSAGVPPGDRSGAGAAASRPIINLGPQGEPPQWWVPVAIALALFGIVLLIDVATPNKKISSISAVMFGLLAGILATVAISAVIELALRVWLPDAAIKTIEPLINIIKPLLGIALCYLGITTILQTQDDFRLVIPYVEFAKQIRGTKPLVLDTSALIDARIADVAATGLLQAPLVIPRFVVAELQSLSDSADKLKRARGRRGLEVVSRLQRQGTLDVSIDETPVSAMAVDQALVELAERLTGRIVTTDLGLSRVAQIHGVVVLNLHEIAAAFKPALIPGQTLSLRLVKPGEQAGQGVGYLDDGTMVVAEGAAHLVGGDAALVVTSTIQTAGGRLVFARPTESAPAAVDEQPDQPGAEPRAAGGEEDARAEALHPEGAVAEPADERDQPGSAASAPTVAAAARPATPGPFPPRPPARKPPGARNPRR